MGGYAVRLEASAAGNPSLAVIIVQSFAEALQEMAVSVSWLRAGVAIDTSFTIPRERATVHSGLWRSRLDEIQEALPIFHILVALLNAFLDGFLVIRKGRQRLKSGLEVFRDGLLQLNVFEFFGDFKLGLELLIRVLDGLLSLPNFL